MTIATVDTILERVKSATSKSPIAVFKCNVFGHFNAVFANTVETQRRIRSGDPAYIGTFDKGWKKDELIGVLQGA